MKCYVIPSPKGIDSLTLVERPEPTPGPRQVLVRVKATSLNYRDLLTIEAQYARSAPKPDLIPLSDGAGEVVAAAVLDAKRGDVVGERSFGAGTEQQLFTLRGGDGLLLTTAKWASPSGVTFLGTDRNSNGVKPSVEVKRPDTPEPVEVEELIDRQDEQNQNPQPTATPTPKAEPAAKPAAEDLQLKKAIELLQA